MGELTIYETGITLGLVAFGLRGLRVLPRFWRNELGWDPDRPPAFWAFDLAAWRGLVRTNILTIPTVLAIAPAYALEKAGAEGALAQAVIIASGIMTLGLCCVLAAVFLFNRPKWAVVPHLRHQSGAIAEWRGKRSAPTPAPKVTPGFTLR